MPNASGKILVHGSDTVAFISALLSPDASGGDDIAWGAITGAGGDDGNGSTLLPTSSPLADVADGAPIITGLADRSFSFEDVLPDVRDQNGMIGVMIIE